MKLRRFTIVPALSVPAAVIVAIMAVSAASSTQAQQPLNHDSSASLPISMQKSIASGEVTPFNVSGDPIAFSGLIPHRTAGDDPVGACYLKAGSNWSDCRNKTEAQCKSDAAQIGVEYKWSLEKCPS